MHRFIRSAEEDAAAEDRWALRLAKRYYAKLYREYAIVDLSRYQVQRSAFGWFWGEAVQVQHMSNLFCYTFSRQTSALGP